MTESTRTKAARRSRRSASQLFIAALVVLGVTASMLLLFSENIQWLRVGLVSALWAAIVGAFAMTKYRRDAFADQAKAKDLQTVYELQLAREISARREYELGVEARVRGEAHLEASEVAALRAELAQLRNNLQILFDGNLPADRVALRADAMRMQELGGRNYDSYQPAPSGLYVPGRGQQPRAGERNEPNAAVPGLATPFDEPVTAETSVLYPDPPIGSEDSREAQEGSQAQANQQAQYSPQAPSVPETQHIPVAEGYASGPSRTSDSYSPSGGRGIPIRSQSAGPTGSETRESRTWSEESYAPAAESTVRSGDSRRQGLDADPYSTPQSANFAPEPLPVPEPTPPREPEPELIAEVEPAAESRPFTSPESFTSPEPTYSPEPSYAPDASSEPAAQMPWSSEPEPASWSQDAPADAASTDAPAEPWDLPAPSPRRRRRLEPDSDGNPGAHSNGRSVAEIMAGLQSSDAEPSERRHRRRREE